MGSSDSQVRQEGPGSLLHDIFLVSSVSVLANVGSEKDVSLRGGGSWCAFPAVLPSSWWTSSSCATRPAKISFKRSRVSPEDSTGRDAARCSVVLAMRAGASYVQRSLHTNGCHETCPGDAQHATGHQYRDPTLTRLQLGKRAQRINSDLGVSNAGDQVTISSVSVAN